MQPDQHYAWVTNEGGVTVIDPATLKVAGKIATGAGEHDLVISSDSRIAFVSNRENATVSVVDIQKLEKLNDVKVGPGSESMALSELSKAIYVAGETDGSITVIDEKSREVIARMKTKPGARSIRFAPGGRYGFVLNTKESTINIGSDHIQRRVCFREIVGYGNRRDAAARNNRQRS
jgi:YVTN family beta-propeller protein